jgi:ELWxxDGT repeat protein
MRRVLPVVATCLAGLALAPGTAEASSPGSSAAAQARPVVSLVDDIAPGPASSDPQDLTAMNGELFFSAWSPDHGRQLWMSNGSAKGTVMLTQVPGAAGADPQDLTVADGELFFSATDPQHGRELWKSNGTAAGTAMVSDIVPGTAGSSPQDITYAIGQQQQGPPNQVLVYFSAWDPAHGRQLWKSNGTAAGTVMISDVNPGPAGLGPEDITPLYGTEAMFSGDDGVHGREPWVTDGSAAGTQMYEDLNPGAAGSDPADITATTYNVGDLAQFALWYFSANDGTHGREFFVAYPGSPPADVYDINPGSASSNPGPFDSVTDETGLLAATGATGGPELYAVQQPPLPPDDGGVQPGTATELAGVHPGDGSDPVLAPANLIGLTPEPAPVTRTYFTGDDAGHGRQLYQADELVTYGFGEAATATFGVSGVRLVDGINPADADPQDLTSVGGTPVSSAQTGATEVFSANDGTHGRELWYSDGWSTNTRMAADVNPGPASSDPEDITVIGQVAYFSAGSPSVGRELWKLTVPPSPQMFLNGPAASVTTGSSVTFTATMQPASGAPAPSGSVTFYEDGAKIATESLKPQSGGPAATVTITARAGTHEIVAVYGGDSFYLPATSGTAPVTGS